MSKTFSVRLSRSESVEFRGVCLASVKALNHDESERRRFALYRVDASDAMDKAVFVAERVDDDNTIDVRYFGARCVDVMAVYDFFGNEPLANYLYGRAGLSVPGLRAVS